MSSGRLSFAPSRGNLAAMGKGKSKLDLSAPSDPLQDPFAPLEGLALPDREARPSVASPEPVKPSKRGRVVLRRETARRGGKTVVVVGDFAPEIGEGEIVEIGRSLRRALGSGGTVKGREIEIQGERAKEVRDWLERSGFRAVGP